MLIAKCLVNLHNEYLAYSVLCLVLGIERQKHTPLQFLKYV